MLAHAGLYNKFWAEAVGTAAYIKNSTVTPIFKQPKTPYEMWSRKQPRISHLKVVGCTAYAHVLDSLRQKLDTKAERLRFIGYCVQS